LFGYSLVVRQMRPKQYLKHIYWMREAEFNQFREQFERSEQHSLFIPKEYPCEVLSPARRIGVVRPELWNKACKRQGSWYRTSDKVGQSIVVSSKPLPELEKSLWGRVSVTQFRPPRLPKTEELHLLLKDSHYTLRAPEDWPRLSEDEKVKFRRYFDSRGIFFH